MITFLNLVKICFFLKLISITSASNGDRTTFFRNCRDRCSDRNCTEDGVSIKDHAIDYYEQSTFDRLLLWSCDDECQYECMWKTVEGFHERGWETPQFYGKWPFKRFLGLQEPASVVFSILNFLAHLKMLRKFRREVRRDSPCFKLWHLFALVCLNGWIWSTVFHARDFPLTELLDYTSAYSIVLVTLYCMVIRMLHNKSIILKGIITALFASFYLNYFAYLTVGRFSYSFNMQTNVITGALSGVSWLVWCFIVRHKRPYYRKMLRFYVLFAMSMSLELLDFPPILWTFDAHSLWHLSSVPLSFVFYSFVIDDCQSLRKEQILLAGKLDKQI